MTFTSLLAFNLALLAALASPGPALLLSLKTTLSSGRLAGIACGLGLGFMAAIWTTAALLGLGTIFRLFPWAYLLIKTLGAAYLLYVAYGMWRGAHDPLPESTSKAPRLHRAFLTGALVNLGNPKSVLFAASMLVVIFPAGLTLAEKGLIVLNHLAVEWIVYTLFALALSTPRARAGYLALKPLFDRIAATLLTALGLRLLLGK